MAEVRLNDNEEFEATLGNIVDAQGRPTTFDGVPVWETSDSEAVDLRVAEDGLSAIIGTHENTEFFAAVVTVTGDARHGDEVVEKTGIITVTVGPGDVESFDITAGTPRPRTDV